MKRFLLVISLEFILILSFNTNFASARGPNGEPDGLGHFYSGQALVIRSQTNPDLCWGYTFVPDFTSYYASEGSNQPYLPYGHLPSNAQCFRVQVIDQIIGGSYCGVNYNRSTAPSTVSCVNDVIRQQNIDTYTITDGEAGLDAYASQPRICGQNTTCANAVVQCIKDQATLGPTNYYNAKVVDDCVSGKRAEYCISSGFNDCAEPGQLAVQASAEARTRCSVTPVLDQPNHFRVQLSNIPLTPYGIALTNYGKDEPVGYLWLEQNKYNTNVDQIFDLSPYEPTAYPASVTQLHYQLVVSYTNSDGSADLSTVFCDKQVTVQRLSGQTPATQNPGPANQGVNCSVNEDTTDDPAGRVFLEAQGLTPENDYKLNSRYTPNIPGSHNIDTNIVNLKADNQGLIDRNTVNNRFYSPLEHSTYYLMDGNNMLCHVTYTSQFENEIDQNCQSSVDCLNKRAECFSAELNQTNLEDAKTQVRACMNPYYPGHTGGVNTPTNPAPNSQADEEKSEEELSIEAAGAGGTADEGSGGGGGRAGGILAAPLIAPVANFICSNDNLRNGIFDQLCSGSNPSPLPTPGEVGFTQQSIDSSDEDFFEDGVERIEIEGPEGRFDVSNYGTFTLNGFNQGGYATIFITYFSGKQRLLTYVFERPAIPEEEPIEEEPEQAPEDFSEPVQSCPNGCNLESDGSCWAGPASFDENNECSDPDYPEQYDDGCWRRCQ